MAALSSSASSALRTAISSFFKLSPISLSQSFQHSNPLLRSGLTLTTPPPQQDHSHAIARAPQILHAPIMLVDLRYPGYRGRACKEGKEVVRDEGGNKRPPSPRPPRGGIVIRD